MKRILISFLSIFFVLSQFTSTVSASSLHFWYANENKLDATGSIWNDSDGPIPEDKTYCFAYGMGEKKMNLGVSWNVGDFTGMMVPVPLANYQRGINNSWYGSNACQIYGYGMGYQLHKDSIIDNNSVAATGSIYGLQMVRNWGGDLSRRPWADSFGSAAKLRVQTNYAVQPNKQTPLGVAQYGQIVLSLVDNTQNDPSYSKAFFYSISLWDSRGPQGEFTSADTGGTPNYIVNSFAGGSTYTSLHPNSQNSYGTSGCSCLWYGTYITKQNLINAVSNINSKYGRSYSTNPADYSVNLVAVGTEMYSPPGKSGWIGSRSSELMLITEYN